MLNVKRKIKQNKSKLYSIYPIGNTFSVYSSDIHLNNKLLKSDVFNIFAKVYHEKKLQAYIFILKDTGTYVKNLKEFEALINKIKNK